MYAIGVGIYDLDGSAPSWRSTQPRSSPGSCSARSRGNGAPSSTLCRSARPNPTETPRHVRHPPLRGAFRHAGAHDRHPLLLRGGQARGAIMKQYLLYIDGAFVPASDGRMFDSINPHERPARQGPVRDDVKKAEQAAAPRAFDDGPWPRMTGNERAPPEIDLGKDQRADGRPSNGLEIDDEGPPSARSGTTSKAERAGVRTIFRSLAAAEQTEPTSPNRGSARTS